MQRLLCRACLCKAGKTAGRESTHSEVCDEMVFLGSHPEFWLVDVKWSPNELEGGGLLSLEHTAGRSGYLGLLYQSCIFS